MKFPEAVISIAVEPKKIPMKKARDVFQSLVMEDPSVCCKDMETGQLLFRGMGELHLEIIVDRLLREHKLYFECR